MVGTTDDLSTFFADGQLFTALGNTGFPIGCSQFELLGQGDSLFGDTSQFALLAKNTALLIMGQGPVFIILIINVIDRPGRTNFITSQAADAFLFIIFRFSAKSVWYGH